MSWQSTIRAMEAAERRQQRDSKKRQRDLFRQAKESAKLSALEQARLEVETYENTLDILLSFHKEQATPWDWGALAVSLPPVPPRRQSLNEIKACLHLTLSSSQLADDIAIRQSKQEDDKYLSKYNFPV
jgi:hypothetical protein